jgi:hypothetical protein
MPVVTFWCFAFADGDTHRDFRAFDIGVFERFDVGELEQLHPVQLPLALAHFLARERLVRLERELTPEDVLSNGALTANVDHAEVREGTGRRVHDDAL